MTGWGEPREPANEAIVRACLAFSILSADLVLQWQGLGCSRPVLPGSEHYLAESEARGF